MDNSISGRSLRWIILEAAYELYINGCKGFTMEDLAIATWKKCPQKAGMRGYEELYPDFRAICVRFSGPGSLKSCFNQRLTTAGIRLELNNDGITMARHGVPLKQSNEEVQ